MKCCPYWDLMSSFYFDRYMSGHTDPSASSDSNCSWTAYLDNLELCNKNGHFMVAAIVCRVIKRLFFLCLFSLFFFIIVLLEKRTVSNEVSQTNSWLISFTAHKWINQKCNYSHKSFKHAWVSDSLYRPTDILHTNDWLRNSINHLEIN